MLNKVHPAVCSVSEEVVFLSYATVLCKVLWLNSHGQTPMSKVPCILLHVSDEVRCVGMLKSFVSVKLSRGGSTVIFLSEIVIFRILLHARHLYQPLRNHEINTPLHFRLLSSVDEYVAHGFALSDKIRFNVSPQLCMTRYHIPHEDIRQICILAFSNKLTYNCDRC